MSYSSLIPIIQLFILLYTFGVFYFFQWIQNLIIKKETFFYISEMIYTFQSTYYITFCFIFFSSILGFLVSFGKNNQNFEEYLFHKKEYLLPLIFTFIMLFLFLSIIDILFFSQLGIFIISLISITTTLFFTLYLIVKHIHFINKTKKEISKRTFLPKTKKEQNIILMILDSYFVPKKIKNSLITKYAKHFDKIGYFYLLNYLLKHKTIENHKKYLELLDRLSIDEILGKEQGDEKLIEMIEHFNFLLRDVHFCHTIFKKIKEEKTIKIKYKLFLFLYFNHMDLDYLEFYDEINEKNKIEIICD